MGIVSNLWKTRRAMRISSSENSSIFLTHFVTCMFGGVYLPLCLPRSNKTQAKCQYKVPIVVCRVASENRDYIIPHRKQELEVVHIHSNNEILEWHHICHSSRGSHFDTLIFQRRIILCLPVSRARLTNCIYFALKIYNRSGVNVCNMEHLISKARQKLGNLFFLT